MILNDATSQETPGLDATEIGQIFHRVYGALNFWKGQKRH